VLGVGLGNSVQKLFYLPEAHTDFVFAIIAEELGLLGCVAFIALFAALIARILWVGRTAARKQQLFSAHVCFGVALLLAAQAFIIIGGVLRLVPLTGITLPFVSYGGSSLLANYILLALLLRISDSGARRRGETPDELTISERMEARRLRRAERKAARA